MIAQDIRVFHVESLEYPRVALFAQIEGKVEVEVTLNSDGRVQAAKATSGDSLLRRDAEQNVSKWKFRSTREGKLTVTYHFMLKDPAIRNPHTECSFDLPDKVLITSNRQAMP
jgi:TonB family protein